MMTSSFPRQPLSARRTLVSSSFAKLFVRSFVLLALLFVPLISSVNAQSIVPALDRRTYIREFMDAFPEGTSHETASPQEFATAVQTVILAHPADQAPAIAYAIASVVGVERAKEVAEAIAQLFDRHPELREQVTDIARAMTDALRSRVGAVAEGNDPSAYKDIVPLGETPAIMEQIDQAVGDVLSVFSNYLGAVGAPIFPRGIQPGEIISHETPIINL